MDRRIYGQRLARISTKVWVVTSACALTVLATGSRKKGRIRRRRIDLFLKGCEF